MPHSRLEYLRCPCCGKVSRGMSFGAGAAGSHVLEVRVQEFIGGYHRGKGHGFRWSTRPIRPDEVAVLLQVVESVRIRLQAEVGVRALFDGARLFLSLSEGSHVGLGGNHHEKVVLVEQKGKVHVECRLRAA